MKTKRTAISAAVLALALAAGAAEAAELRASGAVSGEKVTVGDVFDGAGRHADRYLAPAPARGQELALNAPDLQRISDAFALGWTPETAADQIVLRREDNAVDRYAIEAALQDGISRRLNGQGFDLELDTPDIALDLPAHAEKTVEAADLRLDMTRGTFTATLSAPAGADKPLARKTVSGRVHALVKVPVLTDPARAGDVISAADIEYVDMRAADLSVSTVVKAEALVGRTPRRGIAAMRPVAAADIRSPLLVKKGDTVTVALQNGTLGLTMQGRALQNGAEGDIVRIINLNSNRTIEGTVTGAQTIALRLPSATL